MSTFGTAFRKDALFKIGGFDESIDYPDKDVGYRLSQDYQLIKDRRAIIRHYLDKPFKKYCKQIYQTSITEGALYRRYGVFLNKKSILISLLVLILLFGYLFSPFLLFASVLSFTGTLGLLFLPIFGLIGYYFIKGLKMGIQKRIGIKGLIALPLVSLLFFILKSFGIMRGLLRLNVKGIFPLKNIEIED
jgi:hypothetical protein